METLVVAGTAGLAETLGDAGFVWGYLLVFIFAAIPWIEILVVIPIGIGVGLDPVLTGGVAFAGNVLSVYVLLAGYQRIARWWTTHVSTERDSDSRRHRWAKRAWDRYGLPGLSLVAPVATGVHLAAMVAVAVGSDIRHTAAWMTVGIGIWSILLVVGSVLGLSIIGT